MEPNSYSLGTCDRWPDSCSGVATVSLISVPAVALPRRIFQMDHGVSALMQTGSATWEMLLNEILYQVPSAVVSCSKCLERDSNSQEPPPGFLHAASHSDQHTRKPYTPDRSCYKATADNNS